MLIRSELDNDNLTSEIANYKLITSNITIMQLGELSLLLLLMGLLSALALFLWGL